MSNQTKYVVILTKDIGNKSLREIKSREKLKKYKEVGIEPFMGLGKDTTYQIKYELRGK